MADFQKMLVNCSTLETLLKGSDLATQTASPLQELQDELAALRRAELGAASKEKVRGYLFKLFKESLISEGITSGLIGEVGGSKNSFLPDMPEYQAKYLSIFPSNDPNMIVADITNCPHVADDTFDAIFSVSVLEHVRGIHDAAKEIVRILKPGGVTMHSVPFSYFFHGAPVDFWRVTTTALETMFEELETIQCFFYSGNRRRNNLGSVSNPIDEDGGPQFAADAFGGWRENWSTVYIGRKPHDSKRRLADKRAKQLHIDLVKGLVEGGMPDDEAIKKALTLVDHVAYDDNCRARVAGTAYPKVPDSWSPSVEELTQMWRVRSKKTVRPSVDRYNLMAMLKASGLV